MFSLRQPSGYTHGTLFNMKGMDMGGSYAKTGTSNPSHLLPEHGGPKQGLPNPLQGLPQYGGPKQGNDFLLMPNKSWPHDPGYGLRPLPSKLDGVSTGKTGTSYGGLDPTTAGGSRPLYDRPGDRPTPVRGETPTGGEYGDTTAGDTPYGDYTPTTDDYFNFEHTEYAGLTPAEKAALAEEYANIYADKQRREVESRWEQALADAAAREGRISASYAGFEDALARREGQQSDRDLSSAIARGAGRSGVVDHLSGQRGEHFSELLSAEHARKMAEMAAVGEQLDYVGRERDSNLAHIADQSGMLHNQRLEELRSQEYERGRQHDLDQFQQLLHMFDRTQITPHQAYEMMINMFDRTRLTPLEQLQVWMQASDIFGKNPGSTPDQFGEWPYADPKGEEGTTVPAIPATGGASYGTGGDSYGNTSMDPRFGSSYSMPWLKNR